MARIRGHRGGERDGYPVRAYQCPDGGWHLTKRRTHQEGPTQATRLLVMERDGYACVRCGQSIRNQPYSIHHRRARGAGGSSRDNTNQPANLLTLCGTGTTG